jgi:hypothetical protein
LGRLRRRPWDHATPSGRRFGSRPPHPAALRTSSEAGRACATLLDIHSTFNIVIWVVCILAVVIAFVALIASRKTWEDFGKGQFVMDRDEGRTASGAASAERDLEIRQLLDARNERRARRGEAPIDVEQELARLTAPAIDPELREEIRQLVVARNHRRIRAGKPPLDVEAEIEREITSLGGL